MDNERLEKLASMLGRGAEDKVDLDRVARVVVERIQEERVRPSRPAWSRSPLLRAAALVGVLVAGSLVVRTVAPEPTALVEFPNPAALEELSAADLGEMLDSLTYEASVSEFVAASLDDLDESQLRELLASLES
jgi:hypothetical protein